jgi:phospholipase/lecithinase/hemolysin
MLTNAIRSNLLTKSLFIGLLGCVLAAPLLSWAKGPVSQLVVFGDSLSDSGNLFALRHANNVPPDYAVDALLVPDDAYARGGHHLTNGETWVEQLARPLGLIQNVAPAFRDANSRATNYAVAGARAWDDGKNVNLSKQVNVFLQRFGGAPSSKALYVVEIGASDVRDALVAAAFPGGPGTPTPSEILTAGLTAIQHNIVTLYGAGARRFLVFNVPDIGSIPSIQVLDTRYPGVSGLASLLTANFNSGLATLLTSLGSSLTGIKIIPFDLYQAVNDIYANPRALGLTDVTHPCITPGISPFVCKKPDEYLFWDGLHPTRAGHAIFAGEVGKLLAK